MTWTSAQAFSGEGRVVVLPAGYRSDGSKAPVLAGHGHGASSIVPVVGYGWQTAKAFLDVGLPIVYCDCGGPLNWATDTANQKLEDARAWMVSAFAAKPNACHLFGFSMGANNAAGYLHSHASYVKTITLSAPAIDLAWCHDTNVNGYGTAETNTAYGSAAAVAAAAPSRSLLQMARNGEVTVPTYCAWDPTDTNIPGSSFAEFTGLLGSASVTRSVNGGGHTPDLPDPVALKAFMAANA